jgi:hypothetical protein
MKSIYNIYERKLNSLLDTIDNTLDTGDSIASEIEDSMKEKFIKIISLASKMNTKETDIFRKLVDESSLNGENKYAICNIPRKTMLCLIKESGNKLNKNDFDKFPKDEKEYNFGVMIEHLSISNECGGQAKYKELVDNAKSDQGKFFNSYYIKCIKLGNAIVFHNYSVIYLEINDSVSLVLKTVNSGNYNSKSNIRQFEYI